MCEALDNTGETSRKRGSFPNFTVRFLIDMNGTSTSLLSLGLALSRS